MKARHRVILFLYSSILKDKTEIGWEQITDYDEVLQEGFRCPIEMDNSIDE
jgi:hypothetical protein